MWKELEGGDLFETGGRKVKLLCLTKIYKYINKIIVLLSIKLS